VLADRDAEIADHRAGLAFPVRVQLLAVLATPHATGLFCRAIVQSGNGIGAFTPEQAQRVTVAAAAA